VSLDISSWALFRYQRQWRLSQDRGQAGYHHAQQQADHQAACHRRICQQKNDGTELMANFPTSARYNVASSLVPDSDRSVGRQNTRQAAYPTPIAPMPAPTKTEKLIASP